MKLRVLLPTWSKYRPLHVDSRPPRHNMGAVSYFKKQPSKIVALQWVLHVLRNVNALWSLNYTCVSYAQ